MISNITSCCRKCLNPNETLYVEVRNQCRFHLYIQLEYVLRDKTLKKQSPVFAPGKSQRLTFPSDGFAVYLKVFNCASVPPGILCAKYVKTYMSSCHRVTGNSVGDIQCTEVPC